MEEMLFKEFSNFSSDDHFVQPCRTILTILVDGHKRNSFFEKKKKKNYTKQKS